MIVSPDGDLLVSSLGWVDKGGVLVWETHGDRAPYHVSLSNAQYVSVHEGHEGYFSVAHFFDQHDHFELTAHRFDVPERVLSTWRIARSRITFEGDPDTWRHLKPCYTGYLQYRGSGESWLFLLNDHGALEVHDLEWFDDSYDKDYQALADCHQVPKSENFIFGIQRCSQPVIYDPRKRIMVQRVELAERLGNCDLKFRREANELWAVDYDTMVVLDTANWRKMASRLLQEAESSDGLTTQLFVGGFCFHEEERFCSVAQPYSNAVSTLETSSLEPLHVTPFPFQPLDVAVVDQMVFARDWRTGMPECMPIGG